jgi:hypothetical protein
MRDFIDIIGQVVDKMSHTAARMRYQRRRHRPEERPGSVCSRGHRSPEPGTWLRGRDHLHD